MTNDRILFFDLDGTLLRKDKSISPYTLAVLQKCREKGLLLGLSTARGETNILPFIEAVQPDIVISSSGALLKLRGEAVYTAAFSPEETERFIAAARRVAGEDCEITVDTPDKYYWNYRVDPLEWDKTWGDTIYTDYVNFRETGLKICVQFTDSALADEIAKSVPDCTWVRFSGSDWHAFFKNTAGKDKAIRALSEHLGIPTAHMLAFGDDTADVEMLQVCGLGAAMGNAIPAVKAAADVVIGSNEEDGVARFLAERYQFAKDLAT